MEDKIIQNICNELSKRSELRKSFADGKSLKNEDFPTKEHYQGLIDVIL